MRTEHEPLRRSAGGRRAVLAFLGIAGVLFVVSAVGSIWLPDPGNQVIPPFQGWRWLQGWAQWDSGWYFAIATGRLRLHPRPAVDDRLLPDLPAADAGRGRRRGQRLRRRHRGNRGLGRGGQPAVLRLAVGPDGPRRRLGRPRPDAPVPLRLLPVRGGVPDGLLRHGMLGRVRAPGARPPVARRHRRRPGHRGPADGRGPRRRPGRAGLRAPAQGRRPPAGGTPACCSPPSGWPPSASTSGGGSATRSRSSPSSRPGTSRAGWARGSRSGSSRTWPPCPTATCWARCRTWPIRC